MKRCMMCGRDSDLHATVCANCGESVWIELERRGLETELATVPESPIPRKSKG